MQVRDFYQGGDCRQAISFIYFFVYLFWSSIDNKLINLKMLKSQ